MRDSVEKLMVSFLTIHDGNHPAEEIIESSLRQLALVNPNYSDISDDEFSWATEEIKKKIAVTTEPIVFVFKGKLDVGLHASV